MIEGKYKIVLDTIIGKKDGNAIFSISDNNVICVLNFDKKDFLTLSGKYINDSLCEFNGNLDTIVGNIEYSINCKFEGDLLDAKINTSKGNFNVKGSK